MAFIPEDGTGVVGANSLATVIEADVYFSDLANTEWEALTELQKRASLIKATAYLCIHYDFKGEKEDPYQGTCFPRKGVADPSGAVVEGVPDCIKKAIYELAIRASRGTDLLPDPVFDESNRQIKAFTEQAGPLRRIVEYASPGDLVEEARYPFVDALICPWLLKPSLLGANGVRLASSFVSGVDNGKMQEIESNTNRYLGPYNENGRDTGDRNDPII